MRREDFCEDLEKHYFGRTRHPHCSTCVCPSEVQVKKKVIITKPMPLFQRTDHFADKTVRKCVCTCRSPPTIQVETDFEDFIEPVTPPSRIEKRLHYENKYKILEKWFRRFDFDGDGLLDIVELRMMLNFLGVQTEVDYCRCLLDNADRDGDGRLSFSEFLLMWRQCQDEVDLLSIMKEYDLYPDVLQVDYVTKVKPKMKEKEIVKRKYERDRICGCESTITKTFRKSPTDQTIEYETKISRAPTPDDEKLPVFSCYR